MAKKIVVSNWKMNPDSLSEAQKLFGAAKINASKLYKTKVIVCPPTIFLSVLALKSKGVALGAQDAFWHKSGPYTGEISPTMLKNLAISYCIVGHSERRSLGETDEMVSKKIQALLRAGVTPILCVGEKERDSHGDYLGTLSNQIKKSLGVLQKRDLKNIIVAYEPVWAIGKSAQNAINSHKLHEMVLFIQKTIAEVYGRTEAKKIAIIYGAAVEPKNAGELIKNGNVSGLLVGHASLEAKGFAEIIKAVDHA